MLPHIPTEMRERMAYLEGIDARDRVDGTPRARRMRQVPPETGRFLALIAAGAPPGLVIEIGTSAGYSTLWLALACRQRGDQLTTYEMSEHKAHLARETFAAANVEDIVHLVHADAREHLEEYSQIAFCFLDAEKAFYQNVYEQVVPRLVHGGLLTVDNAISHREELASFIKRAHSDRRVNAKIIPIGKGILLCCKSHSQGYNNPINQNMI